MRAPPQAANLVFEAAEVTSRDFDGATPTVRYRHGGQIHELTCDFIAGCDGYHGVCRRSIPRRRDARHSSAFIRSAGWASWPTCRPVGHELIYSNHARGFALCSMRSLTRSRYYVQCGLEEKVWRLARCGFWDELRSPLAARTSPRRS